MRVLYTHSSSLIGGGNKVLLGLFEGLDRLRVHPVSVLPEAGPMEAELESREVPYFILDLRPKCQSKLAAGRAVVRLAAKCLSLGIDLLHANDPLTYRASSWALGWGRVVRVCHVHHPGQTPKSLEWAFRRPPRLVVTPSDFMKRMVEDCLPDRSPIRVETVWNQVDTEWFRPPNDINGLKVKLGLSTGGKNVSILGALAPHKGHVCFLRMACLILRRLPTTQFHIVGGARPGHESYAASLRGLARELGIEQQVRFWDFVAHDIARDLLGTSDLFVFPSQEEGFGLAPAEAEACQVPVLTSAIAPLNEVVEDGRTGFLLPPRDHEAFAERALKLLQDEEARRTMGFTARNRVVERFSRKAHVGRMMDLYEEVLPGVRKGVGSLFRPQ